MQKEEWSPANWDLKMNLFFSFVCVWVGVCVCVHAPCFSEKKVLPHVISHSFVLIAIACRDFKLPSMNNTFTFNSVNIIDWFQEEIFII
jgi:hypothetical protein